MDELWLEIFDVELNRRIGAMPFKDGMAQSFYFPATDRGLEAATREYRFEVRLVPAVSEEAVDHG